MYFNYLKYILEIANTGSIGRASENMHISQPGLSRILKSVEKDFQITIFERTHVGVTPTKQGIIFLEFAQNVLNQYNIVQSKLHPPTNQSRVALKGVLNIYLAPGIAFAPINNNLYQAIEIFTALYPNVHVYIQNGDAQEVLNIISSDGKKSSIAFLILPYSSEKNKPSNDFSQLPSFLKLKFFDIFRYQAMVGRHSIYAQSKQISVKKLLKEPLSLLTTSKDFSGTALITQLSKYGKPKIAFTASSPLLWLKPIVNCQAISFSSSDYTASNFFHLDSEKVGSLLKEVAYIKTIEPLEACSACVYPVENDPIIETFFKLLYPTSSISE